MDSGFVPPTIYNPITAPTAVGIAGSMEDFAVSLLQLLRHFKWYHATVLMEYSNGATLYDLIYGPLKGLLLSNKKYQDLRVERTQYVLRNEESYMAALKFASKRSRGTVFFLMKIDSVRIWFSSVQKRFLIYCIHFTVFLMLGPTVVVLSLLVNKSTDIWTYACVIRDRPLSTWTRKITRIG